MTAESPLDRHGRLRKNNTMCLAIPGQIVAISDDSPTTRQGTVDFGGLQKNVNFAFVPDAQIGNYVLVHVGFAISIVDQQEARRVFDYLRQMNELAELGPP